MFLVFGRLQISQPHHLHVLVTQLAGFQLQHLLHKTLSDPNAMLEFSSCPWQSSISLRNMGEGKHWPCWLQKSLRLMHECLKEDCSWRIGMLASGSTARRFPHSGSWAYDSMKFVMNQVESIDRVDCPPTASAFAMAPVVPESPTSKTIPTNQCRIKHTRHKSKQPWHKNK